MKIFTHKTDNKSFNHFFITKNAITCFTFFESTEQTDSFNNNISTFLNTHTNNFTPKPANVRGEDLSEDLAGRVFFCAGAQTLDLAKIYRKYDIASYAFIRVKEDIFPAVFNRFIYSYLNKLTNKEVLEQLEGNFIAKLSIPFKDNSIIDDSNVLVVNYGSLGCKFSGIPVVPEELTNEELEIRSRNMLTPKITISGPDSITDLNNGEEYIIDVKWADGRPIEKDVTVYLKSDAGYLSKNKVTTNNGIAKIKVIPLGLNNGDHITLKAGFKYLPGLTKKGIDI